MLLPSINLLLTNILYFFPPSPQPQQQLQQPPQPAKELFSIDSLREIVDKSPLARPDPFDPPSPPLSAFLPPPPEGSIREESQPTGQQSNAVPQFAGSHSNSQQENNNHHQQYHHQQQQQYSSQPQIQHQYAAPQAPSSYVYKETIVESPIGSAPTASASGINEESELAGDGAEGEDEGLPYNTESLDEEGKKLSYVYSRPVRLPDSHTKVVESGAGAQSVNSQYNQEMEHIYRKPVSYENDEDGVEHTDEGAAYGMKQQQITPQGYEEGDKSMPYQQGVLSLPLNQPNMVSMYSDDGNYNGKPGGQQPQAQWTTVTASNDNRPEFADQGSKDGSAQGLQAPIEYGGFVPIKKPGQHGPIGQFQQVGGDVYSVEKQQKNNFFNVDQRPQVANFHPMSPGVIPADHSGYVGPNNISPSGQAMNPMSGHYQMQQQQQQQQNGAKYGNNVNNFLSKFPNLRFKPLYGKDAMKKLRELGISEDEFYGTVNKILKNSPVGHSGSGPIYSGQLPFTMPKANMYRAPPKNGHLPHRPHPMSGPMANGGNKMRPLGNGIPDEFDFSK